MLGKIKSKLLTKLFIEWVNDEYDVELLEASKVMIQQRQDVVNTLADKAIRLGLLASQLEMND